MKRRSFNNLLGKYVFAQSLLPLLVQSCSKEELEDIFVPFDGKIAIIGAGVAGMYAAQLLQSRGYHYEVYEASSRIGGRLAKDTSFSDFPIDLGAQWLHGKKNLIGQLINDTQTPIQEDESEEWFWYEGKIVSRLPKDLFGLFEREDQLPDISFKDFVTSSGFDATYSNLLEAIAGDSGASADKISAYWKVKEEENWSSGDTDYKFRATYYDLFYEHIAKTVLPQTKLATPINSIDYAADQILLTAANGEVFTADKVIVTVPISILQAQMIQFVPALPAAKQTAFQKIGIEPGMKVFLKFSERFYKENLFGGSTCAAYIDEKAGKTGNDHVLLAILMGDQARRLSSLGSHTAIVAALLNELDAMYGGRASQTFQKALVKDWSAEPYIRGAYSYSTIGMGDARKVSAASVDNKIFFAGEAMNTNGHHQTVFGAAETGQQALADIFHNL